MKLYKKDWELEHKPEMESLRFKDFSSMEIIGELIYKLIQEKNHKIIKDN